MAEIRLLAAPVILTPMSGLNSASTSLVPFSLLPAANQIIPRSDSTYPNDSFVWSASAGENGSFNFYATPLKSSLNGGTSSQTGFQSPYGFASNWNALNLSSAVAQYQLHASMTMPMYGHSLNVFA
jgi:hypothetical protein